MKHIFIVGCKCIPANYGGFETFVDELVSRKRSKELKYHVACMNSEQDIEYKGAECFSVKVPNIGPARAVLYDLRAIKQVTKITEEQNIHNGVLYILACRIGPFVKHATRKLRKRGFKIYVNPDGHEWMRAKWNAAIKKYWKLSEKLMVKHADLLICDSKNIEKYIHEDYGKYSPKTTFIAYGADTTKSKLKENSKELQDWYKKFNIELKNYYLIVGRFVPENNYETIIREFMQSKTKKDLVIITNVEHNKFYDKLLEATHFDQDPRIKFVGTVYDKDLLKKIRELSFAYIHGHSVGGTNPSLLEALASTDLNILYDCGFNKEVAEDGVLYFTKEDNNLADLINSADTSSRSKIQKLSAKAKNRISQNYSWSKIVKEYENVFEDAGLEERAKISRRRGVAELIISFFYAFRQSTKVFFPKNSTFSANLDPFYLFGILYIPTFLRKIKRQIAYILPILLYAILQLCVIKDLSIVRLLVNISKIVLCIFAMLYAYDNSNKLSIYKIVKWSSIFIFVTSLAALVLTESEILWRFNDLINKYSSTRLHGLFLEPSELGFHAMILIICLLCYFAYARSSKKLQITILILLNLITLYLAQPFGAVIIGIVSISCIAMIAIIKSHSLRIKLYALAGAITVMAVVFVAWQTQNPIVMRLVDTISGKDASNNYRIGISVKVVQESLKKTNGLGVGFGNLHTNTFRKTYSSLGLTEVVANSFQYFIIEGGIFSIVFLIALWIVILKKSQMHMTYMKMGILIFLFLYQILGGHFTSGLTWVLYGVCMSDYTERKDVEIRQNLSKARDKESPVKIMFLHTGAELYGADKILMLLSAGISSNAFVPVVVLPEDGPLRDKLEAMGVRVKIMPYPIIRRKYFNMKGIISYVKEYRRVIPNLQAFAELEKIDIIHNNTMAVLEGITLRKKLGIPLVVHVHEIIQQPKVVAFFLYNIFCHSADIVVAVSRATSDNIRKFLLGRMDNVVVIHNGIEIPKIQKADQSALRKKLGFPEDKKVIALIGRVNAFKGQPDFVEMMTNLGEKDFHGIIVGNAFSGQEWRIADLENQIKTTGQAKKITYYKFRNDIQEIMQAMDALIVPSIKPDPFPTVALEAFSVSKPVIAYKCGGVEEMISDGENGFLVDVHDTSGMASRVKQCLKNDQEYQKLCLNARSTVVEKFNITRFIDDFKRLYKKIINEEVVDADEA